MLLSSDNDFPLQIRGTPNKEPCTLSHINQLANQLQQLAENVANLQEANEEFKSRYQQENLLAEVGDMKVYLELLVIIFICHFKFGHLNMF